MLRALCALLLTALPLWAQVANFEDLTLSPGSYVNNTAFTSGGVSFNNSYNSTYGSWSGFSYSNVKDITTAGYTNQYAAYQNPLPTTPGANGAGAGGSANYAVGYDGSPYGLSPIITLPTNTRPVSIAITNTTYTALSILEGDQFSSAYTTGGYFLLHINGLDANGNSTGTVNFYLANYLSANPAQQYVISNWTTVDLSSLGSTTASLLFSFDSSDVGPYGINTPTYFAMDDFTYSAVVPEPEFLGVLFLFAGGYHALRRRR